MLPLRYLFTLDSIDKMIVRYEIDKEYLSCTLGVKRSSLDRILSGKFVPRADVFLNLIGVVNGYIADHGFNDKVYIGGYGS